MESLDPLGIPLDHFNLIEASAGTGKTYTLTALYVRLVVEAGIPVNRILVVTYTNAATKELRDRIRERLGQVRQAFLRGRASEEDDLATRLLDLQRDRDLALRRLTNAARGFDEAAIFTIHGFCKRVLGDNAFESGLSFDTELLADTADLLQEIVDDFWRRELYGASPSVVRYVLDERYSPERLLGEIQRHLGKPYLNVLTPGGQRDGAALEQGFVEAFRQAGDLWSRERTAIEALLLKSPALNRNKYGLQSIPVWLESMERYLAAEPPAPVLFGKFDQFTASRLHASVNKGKTAPQHPFFDACETLKVACEALADYCRHQLPVKLLAYCNAELATRKRRQQLQSYDDLLVNLHEALGQHRQGAALSATLRRRYFAALIDEFQDTDPVQYAIFRRIYAGTGKPVFLVGDPKQAIYSFRGADIFAYLTARRDAPRHYTLDVNWRSDPRLLQAFNAVFGAGGPRPFLFEGIPFHPARPTERKPFEPLWLQGRSEPPFQLWLLEADAEKPIAKGIANERAIRATAAEIARLLNLGARGQARIGEGARAETARDLTGGDIAVLVRSHRQGRAVQEALLRLGVPSVQQADDSVFASEEARQLEWLLAAVAEPGNEGGVRALLASELFGLSGEALYRLREDERAWAGWLETLQNYRQLWLECGFIRFFRAWLIGEGVPRRLLAFRDGERRLTNLLHLGELLHLASRARPGLAGLCKWLVERRRLPGGQDEEHQLRLESDENLVRIVTVHKSKGLEYPVVFCPFAWNGKLRSDAASNSTLLYHDPLDPSRTFLAFGAGEGDPARPLARHEEMAENLRLFYVALTRAKQRCYLVWGKIKDAGTAPPAWLLHHPPAAGPSQDALDVTRKRFEGLTPGAFLGDVQAAFAAAEGVAVSALPRESGQRYQPPSVVEPESRARPWTGTLMDSWRVGSFSALATGQSGELPDYDMAAVYEKPLEPLEPSIPAPGVSIFDFPRGARAGTCLHAIFERWDFTQRDRARLEELVAKTLKNHGLDPLAWTAAVSDMVEKVLATPLDANGLRLAWIAPAQRLDELEFYYPINNLKDEALRRVLARHGRAVGPLRETVERLEFSPLRGYMKGFIDLVFEAQGRFYLADYKSNWLGPEPAAYRRARLDEAMAREAYLLQYLIYSIAVHRYLRLRVPNYDYERHFGGVFYFFLRGMDPQVGPECGVFQDRPTLALITALDELMATGGTAA
ncbi:MAG TPA: exodeoxyribonuclease V subunit beta [Candidatus Competibacter sp.]|nr:exodeoxyribonuclease V subunit beta [Candidatus Competibacteraceae bacterium]HUM95681.1 exodeoxyribonuclease V subunit beta [Candidatus Competibacter sp.]